MNDDINRDRRYPSDDGSEPGNSSHPSVELLSEYLDESDGFTTAEREAIEGHLAGCRECQLVLLDLRLMLRTLNSLPEREAPRRFALTPAMVEPARTPARPAPVVLQESTQWHARHASKVRWASAVAAALFVFVISADLVTNGLRGATGTDDSADDIVTMQQADDSDAQTEAYSQEQPASEATPAAVEDAPMVAEEEEAGEVAPGSEDVPQEEAEPANEEVPETESDAALTTQDDDEVVEDDEASALSMETKEVSDEPQSEVSARGDPSQMRWRIAEVSLALVLALLLAVMIGLPKQRGSRR